VTNYMTKKDEFVEAYKKATGQDPAKIDKSNKVEVKVFLRNLKKHKLTSLFREAVDEANDPQAMVMAGMAGLFDNV